MEKEIIYINGNKTSCSGVEGSLGHPLVYLAIPKWKDNVTCPYCSKNFVFKKQKG